MHASSSTLTWWDYPQRSWIANRLNSRAVSASALRSPARSLQGPPCSSVMNRVSALDALILAQVLNLLAELKAHLNMNIFISHDLGFVRHLSDRVIVMRKGASSRPAPGTRYSSIRVPTTPEA